MESISPLQGTHINQGVLVELSISNNVGAVTTYYFSTAYRAVTWSGHTYTPLGAYLNIGNIQSDISGTNDEVTIALSGIESAIISFVLDDSQYRIKGSPIKIRRAFFNQQTQELESGQVYLRYSGYVTNYNIAEDYDQIKGDAANTVTLQCSSVHSILENRRSGRRTNPTDEKYWYPSDTSMDLVPGLHNASFDFGKPYKGPGNPIRGGGGGGGKGGSDDFNIEQP